MPEIIEGEEIPEIKPNPEIKSYKKIEGSLVVEKTHDKPVVHSETHNIEQVQARIDKINEVIALWENKKTPFQAIIDKYEELV